VLAAIRGLSIIRIAFGIYFLVSAGRKTAEGWLASSDALMGFVNRQLEGSTPPYDAFLTGIVLPNADAFAKLVVVGEWVAGLSLALGLFTRRGAITGMWLVLNYMLAKGLPSFDGSQDRLFFVSCGVLALCSAGLVWGLDGVLRHGLARHGLTRALAGIPAQPRPVPWAQRRRVERPAA